MAPRTKCRGARRSRVWGWRRAGGLRGVGSRHRADAWNTRRNCGSQCIVERVVYPDLRVDLAEALLERRHDLAEGILNARERLAQRFPQA